VTTGQHCVVSSLSDVAASVPRHRRRRHRPEHSAVHLGSRSSAPAAPPVNTPHTSQQKHIQIIVLGVFKYNQQSCVFNLIAKFANIKCIQIFMSYCIFSTEITRFV